MLRFRLFGVPFEVAPYFWVVSALLSGNIIHGRHVMLLLAVWVACVFVSIVVHELGHALTARHFGADPKVEMYAMGGLTRMGGGQFTRGQDFLVILGGPAAGIALYMVVRAAIYYLVTSVPTVDDFLAGDTPGAIAAASALSSLSFINLVWTLFNLLPILPLDGGQLMRNLLGYGRMGAARVIGAVCAAGCAVWAFSVGQQYTAFFLGMLAFQNFQAGRALPGSAGR